MERTAQAANKLMGAMRDYITALVAEHENDPDIIPFAVVEIENMAREAAEEVTEEVQS